MKLKNVILTALGVVFLALGAVGIVLPGLPATPFILLAAACFASGNAKIYGWMQRNRFFGPYLENYRTKQGVKKSWKIKSIAFLWITLIISMVTIRAVWAYILLGIIGLCVTIHLLMIKTKVDIKEEKVGANTMT